MTRPRPFTGQQISWIVACDDAEGFKRPPHHRCRECQISEVCHDADTDQFFATIAAQAREIERLKAVAVAALGLGRADLEVCDE